MSDNLKIWHEEKIGNDTYFCLENNKYDKKIVTEDNFEPTIENWIKEDSNSVIYLDKIFNKVLIQKNKNTKGNKELLPGCYKHYAQNYPTPERLQPINIRKDKFVNVSKSLNKAIFDIKNFLNNKDKYENLQMSYRRGYLFYGSPGNGKTAQIRDLCRNLFSEAIVIWTNKGFSVQMTKALADTPYLKVFIIEEISSQNEDSLYIKDLLSFLDGENALSNSILIATTNYPHELEKNLVDRPGRFDLVLEIPNPTKEEANLYFENFLGRKLEKNEIDLESLSVAYIKEIVLQHFLFNTPLSECVKNIKNLKKKIKEAFPEKEQSSMGLNGSLEAPHNIDLNLAK